MDVFLVFILINYIFSGCDMDSPRRPSPEGRGEEEAFDGQGALHLAAAWGLELVVQTLIEHGADVNLQVDVLLRILKWIFTSLK